MAQIFQMRVRMKNLMGVMEGGSIPALNNLEEALKAEQKVPRLFTFSSIFDQYVLVWIVYYSIHVPFQCNDVWLCPHQAPPGTARRKRKSDSRKQFVDSGTRPSPRGFGGGN